MASGGGNDTRVLRAVFSRMARPVAIKAGGYPEDIFLNLSEADRQKYECLICYMILRDPRECTNGHNFCASCVYAWTLTGGANSAKCPVCRIDGRYQLNSDYATDLGKRLVKCPLRKCEWRGKLREYKNHQHTLGKDGKRISKEYELPPIIISNPKYNPPMSTAFPGDASGTRGQHDQQLMSRSQRRANYAGMMQQVRQGRERLQELMSRFSAQLRSRRERIETLQRDREQRRVEQMGEVRDLGRRLGDVAYNLMELLDNMDRDSQRYRAYIATTTQADDALEHVLYEPEADETQAGSTQSTPRFPVNRPHRLTPRLSIDQPPGATSTRENNNHI